jgi:hypothetical protein
LRLRAEGAEADTLRRFFDGPFADMLNAFEARARQGYLALGLDFDAELAEEMRTLSPSDFGFHNAIRKTDGTLCFIDFEYFGWDDPVKLTADFLHHPGMALSNFAGAGVNPGAVRAVQLGKAVAKLESLRSYLPNDLNESSDLGVSRL